MTTDQQYTTKQVADALGVTTGRVRQIARALNLGTWIGSVRIYSETDLEAMRQRRVRQPSPQVDPDTPCK